MLPFHVGHRRPQLAPACRSWRRASGGWRLHCTMASRTQGSGTPTSSKRWEGEARGSAGGSSGSAARRATSSAAAKPSTPVPLPSSTALIPPGAVCPGPKDWGGARSRGSGQRNQGQRNSGEAGGGGEAAEGAAGAAERGGGRGHTVRLWASRQTLALPALCIAVLTQLHSCMLTRTSCSLPLLRHI